MAEPGDRLTFGGTTVEVTGGMHAAVYQARPDVNAIVHTHQPYASALAVVRQPIPALFDGLQLREFSLVDDAGVLHERQPLSAAAGLRYGCGLFVFSRA